ncbi:uncharacterized protein LOC108601010 isoform X2 [Drosophila busckii]|uniref:uncharacterized protein LOC108601010 isoform X2 n=1 Tax=Drosophila busckii TaxID=30019 RepID=UPI00083EEDB0|nr:uncharacterized protein LOC108601010 isoform X2 [Drosophila busckii]
MDKMEENMEKIRKWWKGLNKKLFEVSSDEETSTDYSVETAEQRRSFVFQTFLELLVFMAMAAVQWVVLLLLPRSETVKAVERMAPSCIVLFGICLLLFMIFALSAELRGMHCVNWLLTFCIVEGNILALAVLIILTDLLHMGLGFLMAALFVVITVFIAFLRHNQKCKLCILAGLLHIPDECLWRCAVCDAASDLALLYIRWRCSADGAASAFVSCQVRAGQWFG